MNEQLGSQYIHRSCEKTVRDLAKGNPVIVLTGPRQSGKTTLARHLFPDYPYVSLEDLDERDFAQKDPRGFLRRFPDHAIIDEVQRVPDLLAYIQGMVDDADAAGKFILTGSAQLQLLEAVTQSLAGRAAIVHLLPFSVVELNNVLIQHTDTIENTLFAGGYPRVHVKNLRPVDWYADYIRTYIERDVRQMRVVQDLGLFQRFLKLCAGRSGQILNLEGLATDCGISQSTAKAWIGLLEVSYICFRLQPHFENFSKRLIKSPKLYFYDTGILCSLLGITHAEAILSHAQRGAIFETFVIGEFYKFYTNQHLPAPLFFWRDNKGLEIDLIIEKAERLMPIEIKSGETFNSDYTNNLKKYLNLAKEKAMGPTVIFGGDGNYTRDGIHVSGWRDFFR